MMDAGYIVIGAVCGILGYAIYGWRTTKRRKPHGDLDTLPGRRQDGGAHIGGGPSE